MGDINAYKLSIPAADAARGIQAGFDAASTAGLLLADGTGRVRAAQPGRDYAYGLLEGNGPPSNSVAANIGQHYFDMTATAPPYEYICVGYTVTGFVWKVFGENGAGFKVLGRFESLEALQDALASGLIPAAQPGDAYFVGTTAPYPVYYFDGLTSLWSYYGPLGSTSGGGSSGDVQGIPPHGGAGQVLRKNSAVDYDVSWGDAVPDGSVTGAKLAENAVSKAKIQPGATYTQAAVVLSLSGWSGELQTATVIGVTADSAVVVAPSPGSAKAYAEAGVLCTAQGTDSLTFSCENTPTAALTVNVLLPR